MFLTRQLRRPELIGQLVDRPGEAEWDLITEVYLGEPGVPVICCATAVTALTSKIANSAAAIKICLNTFTGISSFPFPYLPLKI